MELTGVLAQRRLCHRRRRRAGVCSTTRCVRLTRARRCAGWISELELETRCPFRAGRIRPVPGVPRRAIRRVRCSGTKNALALCWLVCYRPLAALRGAIVLEPTRGRSNSALTHSNASLQGNDEFAVETTIVHSAAAAKPQAAPKLQNHERARAPRRPRARRRSGHGNTGTAGARPGAPRPRARRRRVKEERDRGAHARARA